MPKLNLMSRKPALWIGFLGIIIPLIVMLVFPYRWLVSLEEASGIARKATLDNYLESVTNEIHYAYERNAQRGLNLPASLFTSKRDAEKLAQHLRKQRPWGARWLFLVFIAEDEEVEVMFFDPRCEPEESHSETASGAAGCWGSPSLTPEVQAVNAVSSSWMLLGLQHAIVENVDLQVDEKNTEVRMILNPITNEARHVVGIAGMILDPEYFRPKEVPVAIEQFLPKYLGEDEYSHFLVKLHDDCGQVVYSTTCHGPQESIELAGAPAARKAFTFVFEDWAIELESEHLSPEAWARSNFMINLSMSALLGLVLLGGTVFTLRTAAREIRLSQMKSDFVSNVSHELRTPLASIRTFGEFLRLRRVPDLEKAAEYGEYIETESRRLTQLINNILDFSKIESGQKTYVFKETELKTLLESALSTFEVRLRQDGFKFSFDCAAEGPVRANVDSAAIVQALSNLLDNAVKYSTDRKEIVMRLEANQTTAIVSVRDFGVGISRREQERIFERFHRVGSGSVHDVRGSGLGLSIVHHIVKAHSGEVSVASEPRRGSIFFVRLPLAAEPNPPNEVSFSE